ncbi:MAG: universal stress protein [Nitrospinae bacterium]|nr:universal stress protein [Nitrospinota bacterium]
MSNNLIAITSDRFSDKLINKAIESCQTNKNNLIILIVNDSSRINKTAESFKTLSPLGMTSSKHIRESLAQHSRFLIEEDIQEIKNKAKEAGIECQEVRIDGSFTEKVFEMANKYSPENLFVCRMNVKSSFSRFLYGSAVENLKENCNCNVVIV